MQQSPASDTTKPAPASTPPALYLSNNSRGGLMGNWLMLVAVLVVCAVPMLILVGRADAKRTMENIAVLSAQETWLRQHGWQDIEKDPYAWLMPTRNGHPRIVKPPLVMWLDMLSWSNLTPADSSAPQLIVRARLVAVAMGLLTVLGVYWAGLVLGDRKLAVIAALVAGTSLFLTRQARIASYDIHMTAWATLAVASALWAMRPFGPVPGRWRMFVGWGFAGVALAGAYMSKGPLALLVGAAPGISAIIVLREHWRRNTIGFIWMLLVGAVLTAPWYLYVVIVVKNAEGVLLHEWKAERMEFQTPFYYIGLLGLMLPWSVWLVGGLVQPFVEAGKGQRRRLLVAWIWFALIFVAFSIPGAKQQRYILPIVPAAALLVGQLWRYHEGLAQRGEVDPGVDLLRTPHWVGVIFVSVLVWPFFVSQQWMVQHGWLKEIPVGDVPMWMAASAGLLLTALAWLGARLHMKWKPMRAVMIMSIWSAVFMTLIWYAWSNGDRIIHPVRHDAEKIGRLAEGGRIGILKRHRVKLEPNEEFLLYARRIVYPVRPKDIVEFGQSASKAYMIVPDAPVPHRIMLRNGYQKVMTFQHDYNETLELWQYVGDLTTDTDDQITPP